MSLSTTYVGRDPEARTTLVRELLPKQARIACKWCGQPGRFVYTTEHDDGREDKHPGVFCSVTCFRTYFE